MGGLYNVVHGYDPACFLILPMLGRRTDDYPRFRDCDTRVYNGTREIRVFTRVGSLNQNSGYGEENLYKDPNYLYFEDWDEDRTYGWYVFKCPEKWEKDFDSIRNGKFDEISEDYFTMQNEFWGRPNGEAARKLKELMLALGKRFFSEESHDSERSSDVEVHDKETP